MRNSAFKKPFPIDCGSGFMCVCESACVFIMTKILRLNAFCPFSTKEKNKVISGKDDWIVSASSVNRFGLVQTHWFGTFVLV